MTSPEQKQWELAIAGLFYQGEFLDNHKFYDRDQVAALLNRYGELEKFAQHLPGCKFIETLPLGDGKKFPARTLIPCNCGLAAWRQGEGGEK